MPESRQELLEFAVEVAWRAGRITLGHFHAGVRAEAKPDLTPVTIADREAELRCRELIASKYPTDGIVGEEYGVERPDARRRWILDPIDGTKSFVRGVPLYGVLVAVEEAGQAVVGVAHFPALNETVWAARGLGCWWDGRRALVSAVDSLDAAVVLSSDFESFGGHGHGPAWERLRARSWFNRTWGDCYGYALVATGRAEAMLDPIVSLWDAAAIQPIIEEAGGVFTDWHGARSHTGTSIIATNAALSREVREVLASGG